MVYSSYTLTGLFGLFGLFGNNVFSADAVANGKPAPEVFLHAADAISIRPEVCMVIEGSLNGVVAAKRAGVKVIGLTGNGHCLTGHREKLLSVGADSVVDHFEELVIT